MSELTEAEVIAVRASLATKHDQRCARNDCTVCIKDERSDIEKIARKMNYPQGTWPIDLEEILVVRGGKSTDELLEMSPDELAELFDQVTTSVIPVGIEYVSDVAKRSPNYGSGGGSSIYVRQLVTTSERRTVKTWRPLSPAELEAQKLAEEEIQYQREKAKADKKIKRLAEVLDRTESELDRVRQQRSGMGL
jgi:hypothetical protein